MSQRLSGQATIDVQANNRVRIKPNFDGAKVVLTSFVRLAGQTEVMVSMDLWGDTAQEWTGLDMPRVVQCRWFDPNGLSGTTTATMGGPPPPLGGSTGGSSANALPHEGVGAFCGSEPHRAHFLLRGIPANIFDLRLEFEFEGTEWVYMRNIEVRSGPDVMVRSFDHGVAIANPSSSDRWIALAELFPGRALRFLEHSPLQDTENHAFPNPGKEVLVRAKSGMFLADAGPRETAFTHSETYSTGPLQVQFQDKTRGFVETWSWDFGDGGTSSEQHPSHTYSAEGVYSVSLTTTGRGHTDTYTDHALVVIDSDVEERVWNHSTGFNQNVWEHVDVTEAASAPMTLDGSGAFYRGASLWSRIYPEFGIAQDSVASIDFVTPSDRGRAPVEVSVDVDVSKRNPGGGDGTLVSIRTEDEVIAPTYHVLKDATTPVALGGVTRLLAGARLHVELAERNSFNYDGTYMSPVVTARTATVNGPKTALFDADKTEGPAPLTVAFTDRSLFSPTAWSWDFGDGGSASGATPSHVYSQPGTYDVQLTVGTSSLLLEDYIHVYEGWTASQNFPSGSYSGNTYDGVWSAWEYDVPMQSYLPMQWDQTVNAFKGRGFWSRIYPAYLSCHGSHTARAWTAPSDGLAKVVGSVTNGQTQCGDGVVLTIYRRRASTGNIGLLWGPVIMEAFEASTLEHDLSVLVDEGDMIYFQVDPRHQGSCDGAVWNPTVTLK